MRNCHRGVRLPDIDTSGAPAPLTFDEAVWLWQRLPRPLVFTNGVFDVLHAGHVDFLDSARRLGRSLVVGLNTDASVRALCKGAANGESRSFHAQDQRSRVLGALRQVSAVVLFDENSPLKLIEALRPEVYVKAGSQAPGRLQEAALVSHWGGRAVIFPHSRGLSTTDLIGHMRGIQANDRRGSRTGGVRVPGLHHHEVRVRR